MKERDAFELAFRRLFNERFSSLYRFLDRLSGDADLAEDLAQEAFVRLHARREIPDNPRAWLAKVASNLLRDDARGKRRRTRLLANQAEDLRLEDASPGPDAYVVANENRARVRAALDRLPPRDRQILLLRHEGYSYREIAAAVDVAETSVGTLLIRATTAFKSAFVGGNASD
jgi:RNA polymerase sigma-70 factor (ECF subfamily)